ncbi:MAG: CPBP family intramembrane glutamic endopeptidase [Clostridiaceae bacterium]
MKSKVSKKKFKLSVFGALGMIIVYKIIIAFIIKIPFYMLSETMYVNSNKVLELIVAILDELVSNVIIVVFLLKKIRKDYEPNFKIRYIEKFNFKLLLCTVFFMLGLYLWLQSSIGIMIGKIPVSKFVEETFKEFVKNPYLMVISGVIIGPIFEEIFMRGIILEGFLNEYKATTAIIASSLIFGLIHLNIHQFINATIIGLFLGMMYYKTRSLILCIVAHMLNNAIASLGIQHNIVSFFVGAVIFIISVIFFEKYIRELEHFDANFQEDSISS